MSKHSTTSSRNPAQTPDDFQVQLFRPLHENFNPKGLESEFLYTSAEQRIKLAHDWFRKQSDQQIVLNSSFGVQSLLMLHYVKASGLDIPVVTVDIPDDKYDIQREYRRALERDLGISVIVFKAESDADKVRAMEEGLETIDAGAVFNGLRASQTDTRAGRSFIERNERTGVIEISPLLDWPNAKARHYIEQRPQELWHPAYLSGVQSQGGAVLAQDEEKTECGLWTPS